jgi:cytochrome c-type protein NapC
MGADRRKGVVFDRRFGRRLLTLTTMLFFLGGVVFWGGFNWFMELTNTGEFCISCHEMGDTVYPEYKKSIHYTNRSGVRAGCPDCHVPKEWKHKLIRKIQASNELYHKLQGTIDTKEKFAKRRLTLANKVWKTMSETNSRECRNCHHEDAMLPELQSDRARLFHELSTKWNKSCIDCHKGISHQLPETYDKDKDINELHDLMKRDGIECHRCHSGMTRPPEGEEW